MALKDYSTTPANNTSDFPENQLPSTVNNGGRQFQADVREWYEDAQWINLGHTATYASATTFTIPTDVTTQYDVGRRVKIADASTLYGTITASSYANPNTTVTVSLDSGSLSTSMNGENVSIGILSGQNPSVPGGRNLVTDGTKLDGIESGATADQTDAEIRAAVEAATDSNVFTDADHSKLNAIESGATADQSNAEIKTAYEANTDTNAFTDSEQTKLSGIESGATGDQTNAEIRTAVEAATDSNVFTDADHSKLNGIESGATADQTASEIRTLVESATDSNVFTDADHTKLNGIATGAEVNPSVISQAEAEAGTATTERIFTAQRVAQAISALGSSVPAEVSNHTRAGNTQILSGSASVVTTQLNITTDITASTFESVGPTGSGATNIWTELDMLPSTARILLMDIGVSISPNSTGAAFTALYAQRGDLSAALDSLNNRIMFYALDVDASVTGNSGPTIPVEIPLHTDQTFKMTYTLSGATGSLVGYYRGFRTD